MAKAEPRDKDGTSVAARRPTGDGALHRLVTGLITRLEAAPLMRRAPAQCNPDEQARLVGMLTTLRELRATQAALAEAPEVNLALVDELWPDLATVLASSGHGSRRAAAPQSKSGGTGAEPSASSAPPQAGTPPVSIPSTEPAATPSMEPAATPASGPATPSTGAPTSRPAPQRATPLAARSSSPPVGASAPRAAASMPAPRAAPASRTAAQPARSPVSGPARAGTRAAGTRVIATTASSATGSTPAPAGGSAARQSERKSSAQGAPAAQRPKPKGRAAGVATQSRAAPEPTASDVPETAPPESSAPVAPRAAAMEGSAPAASGRDLRQAVLSVMRSDRGPWSGARIATHVQEKDPLTTREQVYDTLYRAADLFRKTDRGWELVSR